MLNWKNATFPACGKSCLWNSRTERARTFSRLLCPQALKCSCPTGHKASGGTSLHPSKSLWSPDLLTLFSLPAPRKMHPGESKGPKEQNLWNVLPLQADSHSTYEEEDLRKTNSLNSNITSQFLDFLCFLLFQISSSVFLHFCFLIFSSYRKIQNCSFTTWWATTTADLILCNFRYGQNAT